MRPSSFRSLSAAAICFAKRSGSSEQWLQRQGKDFFSREAKVRQYKSRAAFKLHDIDKKYHIFKRGMTVVDLGYAPGAWSQVAVEKTKQEGRVFGVDILLSQPPVGVNAIQGNFLSKSVQDELKMMIANPDHGRLISSKRIYADQEELEQEELDNKQSELESEQIHKQLSTSDGIDSATDGLSYLEIERELSAEDLKQQTEAQSLKHLESKQQPEQQPEQQQKAAPTSASDKSTQAVDIVLSDMCDPWPQSSGYWLRSVNDPFVRMQNTSGLPVKDHTASITGGSFVCKFYTGPEDKYLEQRLRKVFRIVKRDKPPASRKESRECYFVGLKKKPVSRKDVFGV